MRLKLCFFFSTGWTTSTPSLYNGHQISTCRAARSTASRDTSGRKIKMIQPLKGKRWLQSTHSAANLSAISAVQPTGRWVLIRHNYFSRRLGKAVQLGRGRGSLQTCGGENYSKLSAWPFLRVWGTSYRLYMDILPCSLYVKSQVSFLCKGREQTAVSRGSQWASTCSGFQPMKERG